MSKNPDCGKTQVAAVEFNMWAKDMHEIGTYNCISDAFPSILFESIKTFYPMPFAFIRITSGMNRKD